jgi:hypothetical protein
VYLCQTILGKLLILGSSSKQAKMDHFQSDIKEYRILDYKLLCSNKSHCGDFAVYILMMIIMMGVANYIFNELCSFGPGTANIFRKVVGLPEVVWSKDDGKDRTGGDVFFRTTSSGKLSAINDLVLVFKDQIDKAGNGITIGWEWK